MITCPSGTIEPFPKGDEIGNLLLTNSLTVRDGEKGPVGIEMVTRRVQTRL